MVYLQKEDYKECNDEKLKLFNRMKLKFSDPQEKFHLEIIFLYNCFLIEKIIQLDILNKLYKNMLDKVDINLTIKIGSMNTS